MAGGSWESDKNLANSMEIVSARENSVHSERSIINSRA